MLTMGVANRGPRDKSFAARRLWGKRSRGDDWPRFRRGRNSSIEMDEQEYEGGSDDAHASPAREFKECRQDNQEAHGPGDEGEALSSPPCGVVRGATHEEHHTRQDRGAFEDRNDGDDSEERPASVEKERAHQETETRNRVDAGRSGKSSRGQARPERSRVLLRDPGQEHDRGRGPKEVPDRGPVRREEEVDEHGRADEQNDRGDVAASGGERLAANAGPYPLREKDRDGDADDRVVDREPHGPDPVHVEPATVPGERPEVNPARVEERLHREAFFDDPVRRAEEEDARPSGLPSDRGLAHHEDAGAVQPDQEERCDRIQPLQGRCGSGEHLRDDGRKQDQGKEGTPVRVCRGGHATSLSTPDLKTAGTKFLGTNARTESSWAGGGRKGEGASLRSTTLPQARSFCSNVHAFGR